MEKGEALYIVDWKMNCIAIIENDMKVPQKLQIELYEQAIPLLELYLKEMKTESQRDNCTPMFITSMYKWNLKII